jgi:RHS repeat-associated protein
MPNAQQKLVHTVWAQATSHVQSTPQRKPAKAREWLKNSRPLIALLLVALTTLSHAAGPITNIVPGGCDIDLAPSPSSTITSPVNGSGLHPAPKNIAVTVTTGGAGINNVSYYANGLFIGSAKAAPWSITWANVPAGSYAIRAQASARVLQAGVYCSGVGALSTAVNITVGPNVLPSVSFASPTSGTTLVTPATFALSANASDSDGYIASVQYFANGAAISGALTTAPYSFNWAGVGGGNYNLTAVATDSDGGQTISAVVAVTSRVNSPPNVGIASPASGTVSTAPGSFTLTANASDIDGTVSSVQYFANGSAISGGLTAAPYSFSWANVAAGNYNVTAVATDNNGATTTSSASNLISNDRPVIGMSATPSSSNAPGALNLQATAVDGVGSVSSVQYFANGTAITGLLTVSQYNFTWANVPVGTYSIVARATDTYGLTTDSAAYSWRVNASPVVSVTTPTAGQVFTDGVPNLVTLSANASDSDGAVTQVDFQLSNGAGGCTAYAAPFACSLSIGSAGTYTVQAVATDNSYASVASTPVSFTIDSLPRISIASPASGTSYLPGFDIPIIVLASDSDGSITKVEFYADSVLISTVTTVPFTSTWQNVPVGNHILTAKATDNQGAITTSASVSVIVNAFTAPPASSSANPPGKVNGSLSVNGSGAANYIIPIEVPPGSAGMVPSMALRYDSSGGNGLLGVGWKLEGLGVVSRCNKTIAQDTLRSGPTLITSDAYCLNSQRLILETGTYGTAGSTYRTELQSFNKIQMVGAAGSGPASFVVTSRNGVITEYGNTTDSRIYPAGQAATPYLWAQNKVTDPLGNYMTVTYANDNANGQFYPTRIDYTGNLNAVPALAPYNSVQFSYDTTRTDIETGYLLGGKFRGTARLTNVKTYAGTSATPTTPVKDYRLTYNSSEPTARSRIATITECEGSGACLPATTFSWADDANNFNGTQISWPIDGSLFTYTGATAAGKDIWIDVNGDGIADRCVTTNNYESDTITTYGVKCALSNGGAAPIIISTPNDNYDSSPQFVDLNGDGVLDLCFSGLINTCYLMTTTGLGAVVNTPEWAVSAFPHSKNWFIDINGDGRADFCSLNNGNVATSTTYTLSCYVSNGTGFGAKQTLAAYVLPSCYQSACQLLEFEWADVTGDGIPSMCRLDAATNTVRCQRWTLAGLAAEIVSPVLSLGANSSSRAWSDVNGDGKADFCRSSGTTVLCTLSTGTGFGDTLTSATIDLGRLTCIGTACATVALSPWVDVNGDGKADYCRTVNAASPYANSQIKCLLSTGIGFGAEFTSAIALDYFDAQIVDANGDSKADVCFMRYVTPRVQANNQAFCVTGTGKRPDLLASITDGLGASTSLSYKPLSDPSVYGKGSGSTYPTVELQDSTHVVSAVTSSDGIGGTNTTSYAYYYARADLAGRGFLGFAQINRFEPNSLLAASTYLQAYPYTGLSNASYNFLPYPQMLSSSTSAYSATALAGGGYLVLPTATVSKSWDLNGAFLNWVETTASLYDTFGNAQQADVVYKDVNGTADGYSQTIRTTYQNNTTTNNLLGLPTHVEIKNTIPGGTNQTRVVDTSYFPSGLMQQTLVEPNNGGLPVTNLRLQTDYTYDPFGNLKTKTVSGANITTRTETTLGYDPQGRFAISASNAMGATQTENRTYDPKFGGMLTLTGPNLLTTTWTYDNFGRAATETRADGTKTTTTYAQCVSCIPGAAFNTITTNTVVATGATVSPPKRTYFDILSRPILNEATGFDGREVFKETLYDNWGRVAYQSLNYYATDPTIRWVENHYDALGRLTSSIAPDNTTNTVYYNGRSAASVNAKGQNKTVFRNSQNQIINVFDAVGTADQTNRTYTYTPFGNLATTTDQLGNTTTLGYDLRGRRTSLADPSLGNWSYAYDNLGQLTSQTDAKSQTTTYVYDVLGRTTQRTEPGQKSNWYYEKNAALVACTKGIGKLCEATATPTTGTAYSRKLTYDTLGRLSNTSTQIDSTTVRYAADWTYDTAGRLDTSTYPNSGTTAAPVRLKVQNVYNAQGYLSQLKHVSGSATPPAGNVYWQQTAVNADGNVLTESLGNGLATTYSYDALIGRLETIKTGAGATPTSVQNQLYHYDALGNLDQRSDTIAGTTEAFGHDNLNRLVSNTLTAPGLTGTLSTALSYNSVGSILTKNSSGGGQVASNLTYSYPASGATAIRPLSVSSVTGTVNSTANPTYSYDANGNQTSGAGLTATWTSFNMPSTLASSVGTSSFTYGPEHQRTTQKWVSPTSPTTNSTTVYLFDLPYEKVTSGTITAHRHWLSAGSERRILVTRSLTATNVASEDTKYLHPDRLGSTSVVTSNTGAVTERQLYDPWGDRRNVNGTGDPNNSLMPQVNRGFTGHEHLDQGFLGLIHMNGRVYDPALGRFLSPDPFVQSPYSTQSHHRYSYVSNNPLNATDPSGYLTIIQLNGALPTTVGSFMGAGGWGGASGFGAVGIVELPPIEVIGTRDRTDYGRMIEQWRNDARGAWIAGLNSSFGREALRAGRFALVNGPRIGARFIPGLGFAVLGYELYKNREAIAGGVQSIINAVSGTDSDKQAGPALDADKGTKSGDKDPSTPTGQRGSPMDVKPGSNEPTNIGDREYGGHALDQMQGRGVPPAAVEDTIQNGTQSPGNKPDRIVHTSPDGRLTVVTEGGKVVTVITK